MSDLKGLCCVAVGAMALLVAPGCPTAATGAGDGGTDSGGNGSGTSGGATSGGTSGGTTGGSSGGSSSTGGATGGSSSSGGTTGGSTGSGSSSGGTSGGGTTGGSTTGGSSGGSTGGSDGGADAGGCVLADCQDAGYTCCTGFDHCVDTSNDSANCGVCGTLCAIDQICTAGMCGTAPCNGSLCGAAGGCCLDSCCIAGQICCEVHVGALTIKCYNATDGCPLSCKGCP